MKKIIDLITRPVISQPILMLCLFMMALPVILIVAKGGFLAILFYLCTAFALAYMLNAVVYLLPWKWHRWIMGALSVAILMIMFAIDLFSISTYGEELNRDYVALIFETNIRETMEFLESYLSPTYIIIMAISVLVAVLSVILGLKMVRRLNSKFGIILSHHRCVVFNVLIVSVLMGGGNRDRIY